MSQAAKNKANRSPEASAFYTVGLILLGIVVISFIVSLEASLAITPPPANLLYPDLIESKP